MTTLLHISASPRGAASESGAMASAFLETYKQHHPQTEVKTLDLWDGSLPQFGPTGRERQDDRLGRWQAPGRADRGVGAGQGTRGTVHGRRRVPLQCADVELRRALRLQAHLGMPAPFRALVSAAEATSLRVGPLVLNSGIYEAPLLARDIMEADRLTGGRLQVGLGAGYVPSEFAAVGKPFPGGGGRVDTMAP